MLISEGRCIGFDPHSIDVRSVVTGSRALRGVARQWVHKGSTKWVHKRVHKIGSQEVVSHAPQQSGFSKNIGSAALRAGSHPEARHAADTEGALFRPVSVTKRRTLIIFVRRRAQRISSL